MGITAILVRLPADMKKRVEERAAAGSMNISTYIRRLICRDIKWPPRKATMRAGRRLKK